MNTITQKNQYVGDYQLTEYLGEGGMGEVYKAVHIKLGRVAAVKKLKAEGNGHVKAIQRFFNEARIQANLDHRNIVTFYDFIEDHGSPYIIMEYVDGPTLQGYLRAADRITIAETFNVFRSVVEAVSHLHACGIIHRDIKLNNIKINSRNQVKLLDFGIARVESSSQLTTTGKVTGTPAYLAPEQLESGISDQRTDVWQLGVLLYEMVAGAPPFDAKMIDELWAKILRASYIPASRLNAGVDSQIEQIIARCLKRNPDQRYQTAGHLLNDLESVRAATPALPRKSTTREVVVRVVNKIQHVAIHIRHSDTRLPTWPAVATGAALASLFLLCVYLLTLLLGQERSLKAFAVRTALSFAAPGASILKLANSYGPPAEWAKIGVFGQGNLYVYGLPGERIVLKLEKNGVVVPVQFEVTNKEVFHIPVRPEEFEAEE